MPRDIHYSNNTTVEQAVVAIWEDNHSERSGMYRAYWVDTPDSNTGSPVIGYCSPGGSHNTISNTIREVQRLHPGETCYRNGKEFQPR